MNNENLNQPILTPLPHIEGGPVFEAGPGWGLRLKTWLRRYSKIILPAVTIVVLAFGFFITYKNWTGTIGVVKKKVTIVNKIYEKVLSSDSSVLLARRALADYLRVSPDQTLSPGQKVFVEEILRKTIDAITLTIDQRVEFNLDDVITAINKSKTLSASQLQKWEAYAKNVRF